MKAIWTIGHSSQSIESFLELLKGQQIDQLADVRRYPGSRAHPHFNAAPLSNSLGESGILYVPFPELGGRRKPSPTSRHTIWKNDSFRAYADYMETPPFVEGLARLVQAGTERRTAIMCSEALWWQCHRSLIADALKARSTRVVHIMTGGKLQEHPYTSAARIVRGQLRYGDEPVRE